MPQQYLIRPEQGRMISLGPIGVHTKISANETGGTFAVVEHPIEPGTIVEPHAHAHEDEFSYVVQGTIGARIGDVELEAGPGSWIVKPRNLMHTFWNAGPKPARIVEIVAPPRFVEFFEKLEPLVAQNPPDETALGALVSDYGLTFDRSWLESLMKRHGLKHIV
jgi:mannose-6-phosphate isomerase-like protein (cupin superfamily)